MENEHAVCVRGCTRKDAEGNIYLRRAVHGWHCEACFQTAKRALALAGPLVELVVTNIPRRMSAELQEVVVASSRAEAPLPMNVEALNDSNEIYSRLVSFATIWAYKLGIQAPGPAKRAWRNGAGGVVGLPAGIGHEDARYAVGVMSTWLVVHLDEIFSLSNIDDIDYFIEDISELFRIADRWPVTRRPRYVDMPHTLGWFPMVVLKPCGGRIAYYPAQNLAETTVIACEACGQTFDEDELMEQVEIYTAQQRIERRARKRAAEKETRAANRSATVRAHLSGKYLNGPGLA